MIPVCITSRYLSSTITGHPQSPTTANNVHHDIVVLARDHLTWAFAEAVSTIEVVQAVLALSLWKEPDDEKAAFFFNRVSYDDMLSLHLALTTLGRHTGQGAQPGACAATGRVCSHEQHRETRN